MTVSNYFKRTNIQIAILTSLAKRNVLAYGAFNKLELSCKCSLALVTKWRGDIPIYVVFTSRGHVNFSTTLDFKAAGVFDFRLKYDPVVSEV